MRRIVTTANRTSLLVVVVAALVAAGCAGSPVATVQSTLGPSALSPAATAVAPATAAQLATPSAASTPVYHASATPFAAATATSSTPAASTAPTPPGVPVGLIALGHSALTGEGTGDAGEAVYENSWATGTAPAVDSIYLRLVAQDAAIEGHVFNAATGGADVYALSGQAQVALAQVPNPELVIIQTIDNDIRCDGTDAQNVPMFGKELERVLQQIHSAAPDAHVLLVGQRGRPSADFVKTLVAAHPYLEATLEGDGPCDAYDTSGNFSTASFKTLTDIIDSYEAEQARVCAEFTGCTTDKGALATQFVESLDYYSEGFDHLNVTGQARMAEIVWPVVQQLLAQ
jgi:lysophospholipase L1-like esterase